MIAVSNIAWPSDAEEAGLNLISSLGLKGVEIAPTKAFGSFDVSEAKRYREKAEKYGLSVISMQSLFFGVEGVHLFQSEQMRKKLVLHFEVIARLASALDCPTCVFGSPGLRNPGDLSASQAEELALRTFRDIGDILGKHDVSLAFEPNPTAYGCRFMTKTTEALSFVAHVDHPHIRLQIDTGTVIANREAYDLKGESFRAAQHLHISEPHLREVGLSIEQHSRIGAIVKMAGYQGWRSLEMIATSQWEDALKSAVHIARTHYEGRPA